MNTMKRTALGAVALLVPFAMAAPAHAAISGPHCGYTTGTVTYVNSLHGTTSSFSWKRWSCV